MPSAQIYIKKNQDVLWGKYKKVCDTNGWSYSEKIMEYVQKMVDAHWGGGSQTMLDSIDNPRTLPLFKTCQHSRKELTKGEFYCECDTYKVKQGWKIPDACNRCRQYRASG